MKVFSYARQSSTRDEESGSCADQLRDNRKYAASNDLEIVGEYVDEDRPHWALDKRDAWFDMLLDAREAGVTAILVDDASRAWRSAEIRQKLMPGMLKAGIDIVITPSVRYPTKPVDDPAGNLMGTFMDGINEYFVAEQTRKVRRRKGELAAEGKSNGGGIRPFGWVDHQRSRLHEAEAQLIQEAIQSIINGESAYAICKDWSKRGITTPDGNAWRPQNLVRMLRNPSMTGRRVHHGSVTDKVTWPRIVDDPTYAAMIRALGRRAKHRPGGNGKQALLSSLGILRCGRCGASMSATGGNGYKAYRCRPVVGVDNCGGVSVRADSLESHVASQLPQIVPYDDMAAFHVAASDPRLAELTEEIERLELRRGEWTELFQDGLITKSELVDHLRDNNRQLVAAREQLGSVKATSSELIDFLYGRDPSDDLRIVVGPDGVPDDQREDFRRTLRMFVESIVIMPASRFRGFDPSRVVIQTR